MHAATSRAPGRIEVLGNHTDYNGGLALACAINLGVNARGERLDAPVARLSSSLSAPLEIPLDAIVHQDGELAWTNYPLGVVRMLQEHGVIVPGFAASFDSDLPVGAGLSSSAALELATAFLLLQLAGVTLPTAEVATLCQRAENEFVGMRCGALDQFTSAFGERDHLVRIDFRAMAVETIPFPHDLTFIVTHSGVRHTLTGGEYNERRERCHDAANHIGVSCLREVAPQDLDRHAPGLDPLTLRRARHVVDENARVDAACRLLRDGRAREVGPLLFQSHESSRNNFENSTPELDLLVAIARQIDGALGARLTGGGFGGATITLAPRDRAATVAAALAREYQARTGIRCDTWICEAADGAR